MNIRKALQKDKLLIYYWFNHKESIKYKIKTKFKVSLASHTRWFNKFLKNKKCYMWIIENEGAFIGQIRLEHTHYNKYEIDIYIRSEFRKAGLASRFLKYAEANLNKGSIIFSFVKKNNIKSLKFFKKNDYLINDTTCHGWVLKKSI